MVSGTPRNHWLRSPIKSLRPQRGRTMRRVWPPVGTFFSPILRPNNIYYARHQLGAAGCALTPGYFCSAPLGRSCFLCNCHQGLRRVRLTPGYRCSALTGQRQNFSLLTPNFQWWEYNNQSPPCRRGFSLRNRRAQNGIP